MKNISKILEKLMFIILITIFIATAYIFTDYITYNYAQISKNIFEVNCYMLIVSLILIGLFVRKKLN